MPAMTRCPSCSHYWDAGDQVAHPAADIAVALTEPDATLRSLAASDAATWLQQVLAAVLPVVEPLVEKWVRDLLGGIK